MLRIGVLLVAGVGAALGTAALASAPSRSAKARCEFRHSHTHTLAENRRVRVYTVPDRHGFERKFDLAACYKPSGKVLPLDAPDLGDYGFLPPALAVRGTIVGYAYQHDCHFAGGRCETAVGAYNMRYAGTPSDFAAGGIAGPRRHTRVKIGSLRVSRRGRLVWISCPDPHPGRPHGLRTPNCVRPGARDRVYMLGSKGGYDLKLLDRGRTIDPSSLKLSHGIATWIHGGHRRHARIT
jgi:hypothetical protein